MVTNKYKISKEYSDLLEGDKKENIDLNRYSISKLLKPTRVAVLSETEDPIEDVSDHFPAFLGKAVHFYLQNHVYGVNEWKLVVPLGEYTIVGIVDRYDPDTATIIDYKLRKTSKEDISEAVQQIKCYAWMLRKEGIYAQKGKVVHIYKDWSKLKNQTQSPIEEFEFPIYSDDIEEAEKWIKSRISAIEQGRKTLPMCTDEEKWKGDDKWAVYKTEYDEKAKRVYDTEEEALATGLIVKRRPGRCLKCECFCPYSKVCKIKP